MKQETMTVNKKMKKLKEACGVEIVFGDDFGDNDCTFHCILDKGHEGEHSEIGTHEGKAYVLTWVNEEELGDEQK